MGYSEYIRNLLRPLRLYELDKGYGAAEIDVLGAGLDGVYEALERAETEALVPTATGAGLAGYEDILPYVPSYLTLADRRNAIMALLRIDGRSFTKAALNKTLSGCGITAIVEEAETAYTALVTFPGNRGIPEGFEMLRERIEQILPCHLAVEYIFIYITWAEMESWFDSWGALESACASWSGLESYYSGQEA